MKELKPQAKIALLFGLALALGLLANYLFFDKVAGISFVLWMAAAAGSLYLIARAWGATLARSAALPIASALFFAAMLAVHESPLLSILNFLFAFYLLGMGIALAVGAFRSEMLGSFFRLFLLPFQFFARVPWGLGQAVAARGAKTKTMGQVARGIVMAIPVLVLFLLLFASADLVIREYLLHIFNIEDVPRLLAHTAFILAVAVLSLGVFGYLIRPDKMHGDVPERPAAATRPLQISVFLGTIAALFLGFLLVQATYLFGGEAALAGRGFTYAEYARRGFFELLAVALITFLLLWASERAVMRSSTSLTVNSSASLAVNRGHALQFKVMSGVLVLEVLLIIGSAFRRLALYENAFGFTEDRLWSHAFTIWLTVAFLIFLYKVFRDQSDRVFLLATFVSLGLALAVMNALNPDAFIARENIARVSRGERFDSTYLMRLSADAAPEILRAFDGSEGEIKARLGNALYDLSARDANEERRDDAWPSFNVGRKRAKDMLAARASEFLSYKDYGSDETPVGTTQTLP